ncbi:MAG: OmpA family protein [Bacteroidales bacterium]|nr:OmpA family protein [Bacteroidales bacterium]
MNLLMNVTVDMRSTALRWIISGLCLVAIHVNAWSQEDVKISNKSFKTGISTGFKEAWDSVKEGDRSYKGGLGTYPMARDHYLYAHQYNPDNAALNYKLGVCYLFTDNKYEAINYLLRAYTIDHQVSGDIHLLLGMAYQQVLEFDKAMEQYNSHSSQLEPKEKQEFSATLAKRFDECMNGKSLSRKPVRVIIQPLGEEGNSKYDDYNPLFANQDTALFFTSRRPYAKAKRNKIDNKYNEDIYSSSLEGGMFQKAFRYDKPFNTENNDAVVAVTADGNTLVLYRGAIQGGDLQLTSYDPEKRAWTRPKSITGKLTSKDGETSACFSPDGKELYYVSRNSKLTLGGKDILLSRLDSKGKWSEPVNLGMTINTIYDEEGVFISPDNNYLYFASKGHTSMGGFDIFRSARKEDGSWSDPENLGYPLNTPDDEIFYITDRTGSHGYYSAIREGGSGSRDICKVIFLGSEKELVLMTEDQLVAGPDPGQTGFLMMPELRVLDHSLLLHGSVIDTTEGIEPIVAKMEFYEPSTGERRAFVVSDTTGSYTVSLPEPQAYAIEINASGYLYYLDILDYTSASGDEKLRQDFFLRKVEVGTKVVLDHIYFETGKAILRPESEKALNQVLRFLENNPSMRVEISGHTDNTGSLRINQKLSRDRASSVVNYLVGKGIPQEMLESKGYADTQPVAENNTTEGRTKNRRVEFKVLSK